MIDICLRTMAKPSLYNSVYSAGWILASTHLSTSFFNPPSSAHHCHRLPIHRMFSTVETQSSSAASIKSDKDPMIFRYTSPFFPIKENEQRLPSALIILNTPIKSRIDTNNSNKGALSGVLGVLWEASSYRICADGGANRLYDATIAIQDSEDAGTCTDQQQFLPDLITGDLDSLRPEVRQFYESEGVSIVRVEDQDHHDLDKSLMAVEKWIGQASSDKNICSLQDISDQQSTSKSRAFIYGGFGGRFDQEMGCINALCVWGKRDAFKQTTIALYDEETCAFALPALPMKSEVCIRYPGDSVENEKQSTLLVGEGPTCGLIPLMGPCKEVITTGLKWNLEGDTPIEFGGLVSSSNRVMDDVVTVKTSSPMLFTAEMLVKKS